MQILVADDALLRHYQQHAKTHGEEAGWSKQAREWRGSLRPYQGERIVVETDHVFENQFNTRIGLRIEAYLVDGFDFSHEAEDSRSYDSLEEFERHVAAQYAQKWPGRVPNTNPLRQAATRSDSLPDYPILSEQQRREANPFFPDEPKYAVYQVGEGYRSYVIAGPFSSRDEAKVRKEEIPPKHPAQRRSVREYVLTDEAHPDLKDPDSELFTFINQS